MSPIALVCLPFAGGGASFFRSWQDLKFEEFDIIPMQLPGHEDRFMDDLLFTVSDAIADLLPTAMDETANHSSVVVFGHSLGAVLAYSLSKAMKAAGRPVSRLVVSGSPGPRTPRQNNATGLNDDAFLARVRNFAGYDHPALQNEELRELLLPALRADVAMHESFCTPDTAPLQFPITATRGLQDELVSADQAAQWQLETSEFDLVTFPGGHMYLVDSAEPLLKLLAEQCL